MHQEAIIISKEQFQTYLSELQALRAEVAELKKGYIQGDRLLTLKQTMEMLGVTDDTLRVWNNTGKLKRRQASDNARRVYYLESEVLKMQSA